MAVAVREIVNQERDTRRAVLSPWYCEGHLKDGRPCNRTLLEMDMSRPSYIRKICDRCSHVNVWVETLRRPAP